MALLWPSSGKHVLIRLMNTLRMFVCTFLLNGGLNQITFLRLLLWFDGLCGAGWNFRFVEQPLIRSASWLGNFWQPSGDCFWGISNYVGQVVWFALHIEKGSCCTENWLEVGEITCTSHPKFDLVVLCKLAKNKEGGQVDLKKSQSD